MQAAGGSSFDSRNAQASILQMIREGVKDDGLDQALDGDARYRSDVSNRMLGWNGAGDGYLSCQN